MRQQIEKMVQSFVAQLVTFVETTVTETVQERFRSALTVAGFGTPVKRGPGRPRKIGTSLALAPVAVADKPRRRFSKNNSAYQCPVPGCKGKAAPIFGMVCAEHKNVAKAKIAKYREQRRASLGKAPAPVKTKGTKKAKKIAKGKVAVAAKKPAAKPVPRRFGKKIEAKPAKSVGKSVGKSNGKANGKSNGKSKTVSTPVSHAAA